MNLNHLEMKTRIRILLFILVLCFIVGSNNSTEAMIAQTVGTCCQEEATSCFIYFAGDSRPWEIPGYYMKSEGPCH